LGLAATAVVRPHIAAALFVGLFAAVLVRKSPHRSTPTSPLVRLGGLAVLLAVGFLVVGRAASFLQVESVSVSNIDAAMEQQHKRTNQGGSEFTPVTVTSPVDLPWATVSVLFRPFAFEAHNAQSMLAALEGTVLLVMAARSLPRSGPQLRNIRNQPYLILCIVYTLLFVYAFSSFSNFGILTRQRVQVLPFVLVFLALPLQRERRPRPTHRTQQEVLA
jgi:hypothetical protein